jgi:hypothetical protein
LDAARAQKSEDLHSMCPLGQQPDDFFDLFHELLCL